MRLVPHVEKHVDGAFASADQCQCKIELYVIQNPGTFNARIK